jgi:DNA-directed RNA polymerase I, II, and III subunit RPABC5
MIIPVKCFTCGNVLANKYRYYVEEVVKRKLADKKLEHLEVDQVLYLTKEYNEKTHEGIVMDELGLRRICCRRHILTHVDIGT